MKLLKTFTPFLLIALFIVIAVILFVSKPRTERRPPARETAIAVKVQTLQARDKSIFVTTYGFIRAKTQSRIVAQVSGRVDWINDQFREGGALVKGEVLLQIEKADYNVAVDIAFADLADAESRLQEETALADQARQDWQRLERSGKASALVLRQPQVKAAEARVKSAQARYTKAQLDLARTTITAPFTGRVLNTDVDIGQVVAGNAQLGTIYAIDAVEVNLPIKNHELSLLDLPKIGETASSESALKHKNIAVTIHSDLGGQQSWEGYIVRTASAINEHNRQLSLIARIDAPYAEKARGKFSLKIGQFVTADVHGKVLSQVISIPNKTIYQGSYVYVYEDHADKNNHENKSPKDPNKNKTKDKNDHQAQGIVNRRTITILWQDEKRAIIKEGLSIGERLVMTPLGHVSSGTPVKLAPKVSAASDNHQTAGDTP